jgi:hypothetical protein
MYFFTRKINSNGGKWFTAGFVYNVHTYIGENLGKGTQRSCWLLVDENLAKRTQRRALGAALLASSR